MNQNDMSETMMEINGDDNQGFVLDKKGTLLDIMKKLKIAIKNAQKIIDESNIESEIYSSITPEQANLNKKTIVFLKRDLADKQEEYEQF
jgi:hypothetical protein